MKTVVSVLCITYNQEDFIRKTIDGFLSQKTSFKYEILIHDDASTDSTREIIEEYAKKYPELIKPIFEDENQYSKGTFEFVNDMFKQAQGSYIAMCEGDDYWTDPLKLQKQVDFLEKNKDYSVCFHSVTIAYDNKSHADHISPDESTVKSYSIANLLKDNFIYTCSVMYRKTNYSALVHSVLPQDLYLHLFHAKQGKIGFIKDVMATYRKQSGGVWWDSGEHMKKIYMKYRFQLTNLFAVLLDVFEDKTSYKIIINKHIDYLLGSFLDIDKAHKTNLLEDTVKDFPQLVSQYLGRQRKFIEELQKENIRLTAVSTESQRETEMIRNSKWNKLNPRNILNKD